MQSDNLRLCVFKFLLTKSTISYYQYSILLLRIVTFNFILENVIELNLPIDNN